MNKSMAVILLVLMAAGPALAGDGGDRRLVTVSGTSELKVVPDEVLIQLAVETLKKDLLLAKRMNDQSIDKILKTAQKFGIDPKDVQTSEISVEAQYDTPDNKPRIFNGYQVRNSVVVTLKDLSKFDALLGDILKAGANSVEGVYFQSSEVQKLKVQARKMAVQAAKEKAQALAEELGQTIGKPFSIVDGEVSGDGMTRSYANAVFGNISAGVLAEEAKPAETLAPGEMVIRQSVNVSFELQ